MPPKRHHHTATGFSLVEAMLAVSVTATIILVLVGLIPPSLDQMVEAATVTAEARIVQTVTGDYQMRPWQDILQQQQEQRGRDLCFDSQGIMVEANSPERLFTARTFVQDAAPLPGATEMNDRLRQLLVLVTERGNADEAFENPRWHRKHPTVIAQTDKRP
jgi:uncharacterized protein (TIGR02598 family)